MHFRWLSAPWLIACCLVLASPVGAAQVLQGHVPIQAKAARELGVLAPDARLALSIGLPLRNRPALTSFLEQLYDSQSSVYRQFLTVEQFTERFGPSATDYEAVAAFVKQHGFTVSTTHPNRMVLEFRGTVRQIEKAFHVRLKRYRHPGEPRDFYAPDVEPSLELSVPVLDITGLDDLVVPRPANLVVKSGPSTPDPRPMSGSGPNGSYSGWDFRAAYAPNVLLNGSGQYVGLVQFDGYYPGDIAAYVSRVAGLTNVALINILLNGFDGTPGANNVEVALDIEMAIAMAPGLAGVMVYQGQSGNSILSRMATDNVAKQLSASWTFGINSTTTQIFQQFAAQGQSYFNASGDDGAYSGTPAPPTDNPFITSVGGTTLSTRGPAAGWLSETTWNWYSTGSGASGSSGGVSPTWTIPTWQQSIDMSTNQGSATMRNIPDVAMVADNVFVIANNGQQSFVGGTSVASPLWAAYMALVNQQAAFTGQPGVGFINPLVYSIGQAAGYASAFHDVRTGNNTNPASPTAFYAVPGYDLCTGWGTPAGRNLINALAPPPNYPVLMPAGATLALETCSPTNGAADPGEAVMARFSLQNYGGVSTTNLVATLLGTDGITPLSSPQSYGTVAQGATVNRQFTLIASGTCGSNVSCVLQLRDGSADLGTATFSLPIGAPRNAFVENFDAVTAPAFPSGWTRAAVNSVTNWVTSTAARHTSPNAAFAFESAFPGVCDLSSPTFAISSASAQLSFRHSYNAEADPADSTKAYDGGVLELKIGNTPARDILLVGGSFVEGGYTRTIKAVENPLNNRQAWSGSSGGFITSTVNLPASAAGQNVQLKWRLGMNSGNTYTASGWYVDSIAVKDGYSCCPVAATADLALSQTVYPDPAVVGQSVAHTLTVRSLGPGPAIGVFLTNLLPANASFVWASPGYTNLGDALVWDLGLLPLGRTTNLTLLLTPTAGDYLTNISVVGGISDDANSTNNTAVSVVGVFTLPGIAIQPTNQSVLSGADVIFQASATGSEPLSYQWRFQGAALDGETNATLILRNVRVAQNGAYSLQVTNLAGSASSLPAVLTVLGPPSINLSNVGMSGTNISVTLDSLTGFSYTLEYTDALTDAVWLPLGAATPGTGGIIVLQDTNSVLPSTRFYRVSCR